LLVLLVVLSGIILAIGYFVLRAMPDRHSDVTGLLFVLDKDVHPNDASHENWREKVFLLRDDNVLGCFLVPVSEGVAEQGSPDESRQFAKVGRLEDCRFCERRVFADFTSGTCP
jgi:hypothetical protein